MKRAVLVALYALLASAGCSQSEPPGSDPPAAKDAGSDAGPPAEPESAFPLRDGARWSYLHSNGAWTEQVTLAALSGQGRFQLTSSADPNGISDDQVLVHDGGDVVRVSQNEYLDGVLEHSVEYDPGFLRFSDAWLEQDPGFTERRAYERTETNAGSTPKAPQARAHVYTVESLSDTVTVPAGTFRRCLRLRRERDYDVASADAGTTAEAQEKLYWFCRGVGKVREENPDQGGTEVLVDYDIPQP